MPTFFRDALLVQLDPPKVESGNLRVADGLIESIGTDAVPLPGDAIVDCAGAVLMPGLVNGHTHLYSALAPGMPAPPQPPRNFHEILKFIWWRLDRAHTLESVEVSGQIGALAAIRCGTTTLIDHHASPNAIDGSLTALENGIAAIGCRGVLCYEVTDRNRATEGREGLAENDRYIELCQQRADGHFAAMVGAHASFTMGDESLRGCVELARRRNVGVHIHVAEDPVDERITREKYGLGLIERFNRVGLFDVPATIFAHGTHLSDADLKTLNDRPHISLAHNPSSNMNNGVGYTPVAKLARPPQLGTDGIGADMWREARTAEFKSHDANAAVRESPDPALNPPTQNLTLPFGYSLAMLGASARFASKCLGMKLGVLDPGAAADLVLTSYRPATPLFADNLAGHFLFAMGPEYVRDVMIAGTWIMRNGQIKCCDERASAPAPPKLAADCIREWPKSDDTRHNSICARAPTAMYNCVNPKPVDQAVPTLRLPSLHSIYSNYDRANTASFVVKCPCGCPSVYLSGYYVTNDREDTVFVGPLRIECSVCSQVSEFFDSRTHGYDGEQGVNTLIVGKGKPDRSSCPICGIVPMIVSVNFHYSDLEHLGSEMRKRAQDFFDGLDVTGQCTHCDSVIEITSFECA